jgi:hypothetical protein
MCCFLWVFNIVYAARAKLSRELAFFISVCYTWLKHIMLYVKVPPY